jgi:hypothetical protein
MSERKKRTSGSTQMHNAERYNEDISKGGITAFLAPYMTYQSVKFIQVYDWRLALIKHLLTLAVLLYVVVYTVVIQKGYQATELSINAAPLKLKGITNSSAGQIFDANDLVIPPVEPDAIFVVTSFIETVNQTKGVCPGIQSDGICNSSTGCVKGAYTTSGILTGQCSSNNNTCEIAGWCPAENEGTSVVTTFNNIPNWTLFIRAHAVWPHYSFRKSNVEGYVGPTLGKNLFTIQTLCNMAGFQYSDVELTGAIVLISIFNDCNLDQANPSCDPQISATRLDISDTASFSNGYNYRFVQETSSGGLASGLVSRNLVKAYGLRFQVKPTGYAGKFKFSALSTTLGAGISFLAISTILSDFIMQKVVKERRTYTKSKFQKVERKIDPRATEVKTFDSNESQYQIKTDESQLNISQPQIEMQADSRQDHHLQVPK